MDFYNPVLQKTKHGWQEESSEILAKLSKLSNNTCGFLATRWGYLYIGKDKLLIKEVFTAPLNNPNRKHFAILLFDETESLVWSGICQKIPDSHKDMIEAIQQTYAKYSSQFFVVST